VGATIGPSNEPHQMELDGSGAAKSEARGFGLVLLIQVVELIPIDFLSPLFYSADGFA